MPYSCEASWFSLWFFCHFKFFFENALHTFLKFKIFKLQQSICALGGYELHHIFSLNFIVSQVQYLNLVTKEIKHGTVCITSICISYISTNTILWWEVSIDLKFWRSNTWMTIRIDFINSSRICYDYLISNARFMIVYNMHL